MKIACLLGSPKGELSVTRHYLKFIAKKLPEHEFRLIDIGGRIKHILADKSAFEDIIEGVRRSDGVIWATPVYFGGVPAQMKEFIEAVFAGEARKAFEGKYAMSLVTSMNFFDHTTLLYLQAISEDLGMRYVQGHAYDRVFFKQPEHRENLVKFFGAFVDHVRQARPTAREFPALPPDPRPYLPQPAAVEARKPGHRILLLTDAGSEDSNLARMAGVFARSSLYPVETLHLKDMGMSGGCTGCFCCGYGGTCALRDGFEASYRDKVLPAEALVFGITAKDRFMSTRWKAFFDRSLFNGRKPERAGPQVGFLVSGPMRHLAALRDFLVGHAEMGGRNVVGFATDEYDTSAEITALVGDLARRMAAALEQRAAKPATFLGIAAQKVLRDRTYLGRLTFRRDHRALRDEGFYDFPRLPLKIRLLDGFLGPMLRSPERRRAFYRSIPRRMLDEFKGHVEIGPAEAPPDRGPQGLAQRGSETAASERTG